MDNRYPLSAAELAERIADVQRMMREAMPYLDAHGRLRPSRATQRSLRYRLAHTLRALRGAED